MKKQAPANELTIPLSGKNDADPKSDIDQKTLPQIMTSKIPQSLSQTQLDIGIQLDKKEPSKKTPEETLSATKIAIWKRFEAKSGDIGYELTRKAPH